MKKLYSLYLYCLIQLQRFTDHAWRHATGFPTLRRSVITPQLYLGGQYRINSIAILRRLGITGIVSMRMKKIPFRNKLKEFHLMHLPTPDRHAPTMNDLKKGVFFINKEIQNNGKVYVHCRAGEGRGPSMAIAYLIYTGMLYQDAVTLIKKNRTFIHPTKVQVERLKEFEAWVEKLRIEN